KGKPTNCPPSCGGRVTEGNKDLPEVLAPENIATVNSNCRLIGKCESDTYCSKKCSAIPWNPTTRTIEVGGNSTLTLGGTDYFICRLLIDNGSVIMAGG